MLEAIFLAVVFIIIVALVLGLIIGVTAKVFAIETDPRIDDVTELLPGANCGGCGFAGCNDFAKAIVAGESQPEKCPVCSEDAIAEIANAMGIETVEQEKMTAIVLCGGNNTNASKAALYNGINDCRSANLIAGGPKGCGFGCLGLGTCARECPFGAIEITNGLAIVHPELCVACGKCIETCPRNIIKMVPAKAEVHVMCSSPDKGPAKKKYCQVACIGCRKCVKASEEGQMEIKGFLVQTNYNNSPGAELIEKAGCPTGCLRGLSENIPVKKEETA